MSLRLVIMGVAGCGKSTVGAALSEQLHIPYRDGDDLHSTEAVEKMRAGIPLTDHDRWPWLDRIAAALRNEAPLLIGCSALRRVYRDRIRAGAGGEVSFVHLAGDRDLIAARMATRAGHYMPLSLLDSQFATLERPGPDEAIEVTIDQPMASILGEVLSNLGGSP
ncbi:gluconokinase [Rhizobium sp. Root274]|uniref:gluconokinase n=1 Tax=unclassified Rhizobium TaxID=2613769 RepID=UPI000714BF98|nr:MULTISPECIES: gluconokinase [unclassified Rhizobium]KQW26318.1 gluconokinase [Rhizobium sp. Root1240]KRD26292.1 gluconokinase [Rhizobium sp. Root274]